MKVVKYALIGAMMLPAIGAFAQDVSAPEMLEGLTMLESNVDKALKRYEINANPAELSLAQLAEIIGVLNDPAMSSGGEAAKRSIESIIASDTSG
jgi:hypothetical protein